MLPLVLRDRTRLSHRKGFTLIELLVVIAIIAILASILFPVFGRARDNARRSSCLSNLKQLGLAWMQYSDDYDQINMPIATAVSGNWPGGSMFSSRVCLQPYVRNTQIFVCPSEGQQNINSTTGLSYAYNWNLGATWNKVGNYFMTSPLKAQAGVPLPSQTPAFVESAPTGQPNWSNGFVLHLIGTGPMVMGVQSVQGANTFSGCGQGYPRMNAHFGGVNMLFADGHVKWYGRSRKVRTRMPATGGPLWVTEEGIPLTGAANGSGTPSFCGAIYDVPSPGSLDLDYNADGTVGTAGPTPTNLTGFD